MQSGTMVFTAMNRVIFGKPAAGAIVEEIAGSSRTASSVQILTANNSNILFDSTAIGVSFWGDFA